MKVKIKVRGQLRAGFCLQRLDAKRVAVIGLDRKATVVLLGQIIDRNEGAIQDKIYDIAASVPGVSEGSAVEVVSGPGGVLKKVVQHSTEAGAGGYPTTLKIVDGNVTVTMDNLGATAANSATGATTRMSPNSVTVTGSGKTATLDTATGLTLANGSHSLEVDYADIAQNMSVREIDVCDGGVAKKMLVIGSAPYV